MVKERGKSLVVGSAWMVDLDAIGGFLSAVEKGTWKEGLCSVDAMMGARDEGWDRVPWKHKRTRVFRRVGVYRIAEKRDKGKNGRNFE